MMGVEGVIFATIACAIALPAVWQVVVVRRRWTLAASELGLRTTATWSGFPRMEGERNGLEIVVAGDMIAPTRTTISGLPESIWFRRASGRSAIPDDGRFEIVVWTADNDPSITALLDAQTRDELAALVCRGGSVALGELRDSTGRVWETRKALVAQVTRATELARHIASKREVDESLAAIATTDPDERVRERALAQLIQRFPDSPALRAATERVKSDPSPRVRLLAVPVLIDGAGVLLALVTASETPADVCARAVEAAQRFTLQFAQPILDAALRHSDPKVRAQAIHAAAHLSWWDAFPPLISNIRTEEPRCRKALAVALGAFDDRAEEAEVALFHLVGAEEPDTETRVFAARTLGKIGTIRAVEHLLPISGNVLLDSALTMTAAGSIRRLQARQVGAEAGQLSVSAGDGRVSMAQEAGDLALAENAGALALTKKDGR